MEDKQVSVRFPVEVLAALQLLATRHGVSLSHVIVSACMVVLGDEDQQHEGAVFQNVVSGS